MVTLRLSKEISVKFTSPLLKPNADKVEHIRSLGDNTLGFEDLAGGGDNDFNDLVIRTEIAIV